VVSRDIRVAATAPASCSAPKSRSHFPIVSVLQIDGREFLKYLNTPVEGIWIGKVDRCPHAEARPVSEKYGSARNRVCESDWSAAADRWSRYIKIPDLEISDCAPLVDPLHAG
jgi:hypothetical protein